MRLHFLAVWLLELSGELLVLFLRDKILAQFVLWIEVELIFYFRGAPFKLVVAIRVSVARLTFLPLALGTVIAISSLLELDNLVQILILEQESQGQVASHVTLGLFRLLLRQPLLVLKPLPLLLLELLILLEQFWVSASLILLAQLEIVARFILVNVDVQVGLLDEARPRLRRFQVKHERVLGHCELDSIT